MFLPTMLMLPPIEDATKGGPGEGRSPGDRQEHREENQVQVPGNDKGLMD